MQEQVNDVQVQVDGGQDVLLRGQLVHQQVGVKDDEATEHKGSSTSEHQLHRLIVEKQLSDKTQREWFGSGGVYNTLKLSLWLTF